MTTKRFRPVKNKPTRQPSGFWSDFTLFPAGELRSRGYVLVPDEDGCWCDRCRWSYMDYGWRFDKWWRYWKPPE